jgi:D-serine deaminase-like pyridoxal phosphate-dependent protein
VSILEEMGARALAAYGDVIGQSRRELVTPALVLDLPAAERNIDRMAKRMSELPANLRPHIKVHKSPELARRQVAAGAEGLSMATVWEAMVMAEAGIDDLFIVNTLSHPRKVDAVAALARENKVQIAVDSVIQVEALATAATRHSATIGLLIEVDTGMDRAGADTAQEALALARQILRHPQLRLDGITGYEGHCSLEADRLRRAAKQRAAMDFFIDVAEHLESNGVECAVRSAGGTATWDLTASHPRVTEVQAGSYVVMDNFHGARMEGFENALFVATSVVSAPAGRVVVDAGSKSIGVGGDPSLAEGGQRALRFDEEHGIFDRAVVEDLGIGDIVELVPGYAPATVNLYDVFHVVDGETVIDVWPVIPRGPGHGGLLGRATRAPAERGTAQHTSRPEDLERK